MAPMMMKVGMLWVIVLSIHAAETNNVTKEEWRKGVPTDPEVYLSRQRPTLKCLCQQSVFDVLGVRLCWLVPLVEGVCGRPVNTVANAYLVNKETSFAPGVKIRYSCAVGYAQSGGNKFRKCLPKIFTWSPLTIECERRSCGSAGEILNGEVIYTGVEFGETATTVCAKGHMLVGKATRTCLSGGWDGRPAFCEAVQCTKPKTDTETMGSWQASYSYRQVLMFRCRQGTLVGQKAIWCGENGTWSAPPPVCKVVDCPRPNVPNSSRSGARPPFRYRASMTFKCNPGYVLVGQAYVSCSLEGSWTPALPKCNWNGYGWNGK